MTANARVLSQSGLCKSPLQTLQMKGCLIGDDVASVCMAMKKLLNIQDTPMHWSHCT